MCRWFTTKRKHVKSSASRLIYPSTLIESENLNFHLNLNYDNSNINPNCKYASNYIKTTKYTLWTFLPLNLWEQFHRFANVYFVFILILNFIPEVGAFAKEIAPIPVLITLSVVAIKDAYEDFRRFLSDGKVNRKPCEVYSVQEKEYVVSEWQYLRPGDFIRLHTNDIIPADILLLSTSNTTGICHIETSNLDGESNLKQREIIPSLSNNGFFSPLTFLYPIEVEAPSAELYKFHGKIILPEVQISIHKKNMLLRGCVLRNTDCVEGIVIYAGRETKAALNNSGVRFKRSKLEKRINMDVVWCVLILIVVCVTGAIGSAVWHQNLPGDDVLFDALDRNSSTSTPEFQGFLNFWRFVIIFQTIIPLPLYVTIEFVKMHQVWHMNNDLELYDAKLDRRIEIRAFNIPEDLGQIEYIFSDKTGTLTENKMEFKRASINGKDFDANEDDNDENADQLSSHSSSSSSIHITTKLSTLKSLLENETIFSIHQKIIHNNINTPTTTTAAGNNNNNNNNSVITDSDNSILSDNMLHNHDNTSMMMQSNSGVPFVTCMHNDANSCLFTKNHLLSPKRYQQNEQHQAGGSSHRNDQQNYCHCHCQQQNPSKSQYHDNNNNNNNKRTQSFYHPMLTDETRIQDFFLALAICNTAVVSVTKNTPTLFQVPPRRKGFRDFFRSGKINTVTHMQQKLRNNIRQRSNATQTNLSTERSDTIDNNNNSNNNHISEDNNNNSILMSVKHAASLSSILSRKFRLTKLDRPDSNRGGESHSHHHHHHGTSTNLHESTDHSNNDRVDHVTAINNNRTGNLDNASNVNISQETIIIDDTISKLDSVDDTGTDNNNNTKSSEFPKNFHTSNANANANNNERPTKYNRTTGSQSGRTFNEEMKNNRHHDNNESMLFLSSRCLPPVIEALDLDISLQASQHILSDSRRMVDSGQQRSASAEKLDTQQHSSQYMNQSDFDSLGSIEYGLDWSRDVTTDQFLNDTTSISHSDLRLNLEKDKGIESERKPIDAGDVNTARTLTVVIHDGSSFQLPVEPYISAQTPSELKKCPLSDSTLFNSYESESPDELCLVKEACKWGYKLLQRGVDFTLLWLPKDGLVCIHVLRILPFDSQRKRMSILFRHPYTKEAILFTKGADSSIMNRLNTTELNSHEVITATKEHIEQYSRVGLRTLVIAERLLSEEELNQWLKEVYEIETGDEDPTEAMQILMDKLESNFILLGATGIEDRLQDGVPDTIEALREAGMHVWVLTGDKQETAVNIARSANLITSQHKIMYINAHSEARIEYLLNSYLYGILSGQFHDTFDEFEDMLEKVTNPRYSEIQRYCQRHCRHDQKLKKLSKKKFRSTSHSPHRGRTRHRVRISSTPKPSSLPRNITYFHENDYYNKKKPLLKDRICFNLSKLLEYYRLFKRRNLRHRRRRRRRQSSQRRYTRANSSIGYKIQFALVIDGESLNYVLNDEKNRSRFIKLTEMCTNVICCRTTPGQKAAVVSLVKDELNVQTLAIGDGANDVNMIRVANVGIGISGGEEGMQAVMASDFAISRFAYLKRLLLVHGHCCYDKLANASLYLFYKDAIYIFVLFWFQMFNGFSGSNAIDQLSQILFSVTMTGLPPFIMGIWDNPLDAETLLANPILYRSGIQGTAYRPWLFWLNIFDALWQSLIIFFLSYFAYSDDIVGLWEFGLFQTNAMILCTLIHSLLVTRTWNVNYHCQKYISSKYGYYC
ncbi:unnamed protein product [Trichobilharzia szidati]|nr:unnamed protein product [Trichobilharzia szidati]